MGPFVYVQFIRTRFPRDWQARALASSLGGTELGFTVSVPRLGNGDFDESRWSLPIAGNGDGGPGPKGRDAEHGTGPCIRRWFETHVVGGARHLASAGAGRPGPAGDVARTAGGKQFKGPVGADGAAARHPRYGSHLRQGGWGIKGGGRRGQGFILGFCLALFLAFRFALGRADGQDEGAYVQTGETVTKAQQADAIRADDKVSGIGHRQVHHDAGVHVENAQETSFRIGQEQVPSVDLLAAGLRWVHGGICDQDGEPPGYGDRRGGEENPSVGLGDDGGFRGPPDPVRGSSIRAVGCELALAPGHQGCPGQVQLHLGHGHGTGEGQGEDGSSACEDVGECEQGVSRYIQFIDK